MKKFFIPCQFRSGVTPVEVSFGHPAIGTHPIMNQSAWLSDAKGGTVPHDVMQSLTKLLAISQANNVDFEEICEYAFKVAEGVHEDEHTAAVAEKKDESGEGGGAITGGGESDTTGSTAPTAVASENASGGATDGGSGSGSSSDSNSGGGNTPPAAAAA